MELIDYNCRICGHLTKQRERVVTNNLPPNVKVLECTVCSTMGICLMEGFDDE
jgi:hypothetical protein